MSRLFYYRKLFHIRNHKNIGGLKMRISKALIVPLSISMLLCINVALGSMVDVSVSLAGGNPVPGAAVYIDNEFVGNTWQDGWLRDLPVRPGDHIVRAEAQGATGSDSFYVQYDGRETVKIILS